MVQFHPFRDVAKESIRGGSRNFLLGGGGRGVKTLIQKRLLKFFVENYPGGWARMGSQIFGFWG